MPLTLLHQFTPTNIGVYLCLKKRVSSKTLFFVPCLNSLKSKKTLMRVSKDAKSTAFWRLPSKVANQSGKSV